MDEISRLLAEAARPRPLPEQLQVRLEALLAGGALTEEVSLRGIDAPRPLPPGLRRSLMETLAARPRPWPRPALLLAAAGAAASLLLALLVLGERGAPPIRERAPVALPTPAFSPERPPQALPPAQFAPPAAAPPRSAGPARQTPPTAFAAAPYVPPPSPPCFPDEPCPREPALASFPDAGPSSQSPPPSPRPTRPPGPPRNLTATAGLGEIALRWEAPSDPGSSPVRRYGIYRGAESGKEEFLVSVDAGTFSYLNRGLRTGTYYYVVRAANHDLFGDFSNEASAFVIGSLLP